MLDECFELVIIADSQLETLVYYKRRMGSGPVTPARPPLADSV